jgi:hypothetical protein
VPRMPPSPYPDETASGHRVAYDLPLRPGLRVRLVLPEILTQADAKRITAFVTSLAFDQADIDEKGEFKAEPTFTFDVALAAPDVLQGEPVVKVLRHLADEAETLLNRLIPLA